MSSINGSHAASRSSQRSDRMQEIKDASEELRRVTRQRAKVAAEKKKMEAQRAAEEADLNAELEKQRSQEAAERRKREARHAVGQADIDAEMEMLEADSQHALRMLEVVSEAFGSTEGGSAWGRERSLAEDGDAAERTTQWADYHTPTAEGGNAASEAAARASAGAAEGDAARAVEREQAEGARRDRAVSPAAGAAALIAPEKTSSDQRGAASSKAGATTETGEEFIERVSRLISVASLKPQFNKELPTFSGDPLHFIAFKSIFFQSTEILKLSDEQNLLRLQTALKGRARDSVSGLLMAPQNVGEIMKSLELLFGNGNVILQRTLAEIRKIRELREGLDAEELLRFACQVKNLVATVRSLDKTEHLCNPELLTTLVSKLPRNLVIHWVGDRNKSGLSDPALVQFARWLEEMAVRALDAGISAGDSGRREERPREKRGKEVPRKNYVMHVHNKNSPKCAYCKGEHYISRCEGLKALSLTERWDAAKKARVCFKCLATAHSRHNCPLYKKYPKNKFHFLLTGSAEATNDNGSTVNADGQRDIVANTVAYNGVLLQVLPIKIIGPCGEKSIYALLDSGSTITLLDQEIAKELGIGGLRSSIEVAGVKGMRVTTQDAEAVNFTIKGALSNRPFEVRGYSVKNLDLPTLKCFSGKGTRRAVVAAYEAKQLIGVQPKLLLGADCGDLMVSRNVSRINNELHLSQTKLGWVPIGGSSFNSPKETIYNFCINGNSDDSLLNALLKENINLEQMWPTKQRKTAAVNRAEELLEATTSLKDGVWTTGLLWNDDRRRLPDSRPLALARLNSVEKKMEKDPEYEKAYCLRMSQYIKAGYAKEVPPDGLTGRENIWFLPHLGVSHAAKPGKVRIVHDAAARVHGVSLNTQLLPGPDYFNNIVGIIGRFREHAIGFTADIADMFLRIRIKEDDSYRQLFLWRGNRKDIEPITFRMRTLIFGSRSSPASAQFVRIKNAERYRDQYPEAAAAIINNFYMDDLIHGAETAKEARKLIKEINWINEQGNFKLTGWASNDPEVLDVLQREECGNKAIALEKDELGAQRLLGLVWMPATDELAFNLRMEKLGDNLKTGIGVPTKREALRLIMSLWDPLGLLRPITLRAKVIMQSIWASGVTWDQPVPPEVLHSWRDWLKTLQMAQNVRIPRHLGTTRDPTEKRELHVFCDASKQAMCGVAYLRIERGNGEIIVSFVASKTRVGPLKGLTIPRMELTAALLGAQLADKIIKEQAIGIHEKILWTDATNVLWWIRSQSENHQQFVANRLGALDDLTQPSEWRRLDGKSNAADDATRVVTTIDMSSNSRWLNGPNFLRGRRDQWPAEIPPQPNESEKKALEFKPIAVLALRTEPTSLINVGRFSQHRRIVRTMAYVMKFCQKHKKEAELGGLDGLDIGRAELALIKESQVRCFNREIDMIKKERILSKDSRLHGLNLHVDQRGIIRISGRIDNAPGVSYDTKHPMVLDGRDLYTQLLIERTHEETAHGGIELVLSVLRQRFWLISARATIKKLIFQCVPCTMRKSKPMTAIMGQLPAERINAHSRCFASVGVDFWGPMYVTVRRRPEKRYGLLFSCLSSRASQIELAHDLSTNSAMQAIRRFIARRGKPQIIMSDNGASFKKASVELKKAVSEINNEEIRDRLSNEQITWKFIPPVSPSHGGGWESMIKSTKRALEAVLKERAPPEEVLRTLLAEVELILNMRPISHVTDDSRDEAPLTPNHLLLGHAGGTSAMGEYEVDKVNSRRQWVQTQAMADSFWHRWKREVLPTMVQRPKWKVPQKSLEVGDLVLLLDPSMERGKWTRGRIEAIYPDKQKVVRRVDVRAGGKIYRRTIVDTTAQYDAVRAYLKELDIMSNVWIGLIKSNPEGDFTWTDYRPLSSEGYWGSAPPDEGAPLCAASNPASDYRWRALGCGGPEIASFICELPVPAWALHPEKGCMMHALPALTATYLPGTAAIQLTADCGLSGVKNVTCTGNKTREELLKELSCAIPLDEYSDVTTHQTSTASLATTTHDSVTEEKSIFTTVTTTITPMPTTASTSTASPTTATSEVSPTISSHVSPTVQATLSTTVAESDIQILEREDVNITVIPLPNVEKHEPSSSVPEHVFTQTSDHFIPPLVIAKSKASTDMTVVSLDEKHAQQAILNKKQLEKTTEVVIQTSTAKTEESTTTNTDKTAAKDLRKPGKGKKYDYKKENAKTKSKINKQPVGEGDATTSNKMDTTSVPTTIVDHESLDLATTKTPDKPTTTEAPKIIDPNLNILNQNKKINEHSESVPLEILQSITEVTMKTAANSENTSEAADTRDWTADPRPKPDRSRILITPSQHRTFYPYFINRVLG